MTRYIYHVSVHNQDALCPDVHTVTAFINNTMGCEFVTLDIKRTIPICHPCMRAARDLLIIWSQ